MAPDHPGGIRKATEWAYIHRELTGHDRLHVTSSPNGLMVDRVFMSFKLCEQLCKVGSDMWTKLLTFFNQDVQLYPKYTPGFLL